MSKASDLYEICVAKSLNELQYVNAERPTVGSKFSDVKVLYGQKTSWIEVKMTHRDNLGNTRCWYNGERWDSSKDGDSYSPLKVFTLQKLDLHSTDFLDDLRGHCNKSDIRLSTTKGGLLEENVVDLATMKKFLSTRQNKYIFAHDDVNITEVVRGHYLYGKQEPAHYLQAGDDFYRLTEDDPFEFGDVPLVEGIGHFKVRVSIRTLFYEIMPQLKFTQLFESPYSIRPGTVKTNPFRSLL